MKKKPFYDIEEVEELLNEDETIENDYNLDETEKDVIIAILEEGNYWKRIKSQKKYKYTIKDIKKAIEEKDNITRYPDLETRHDCCDDLISCMDTDTIKRYFDYDAYHQDCDYDITEAYNWIVLQW